MRKVCILTSVHPALDVRIFHKEARTLAGAGYDVVLIAQHDRNEIVDEIKIIALQKPKSRFERIFFLTIKTLRFALRQKADVCHFHDPELIPVGLFLKVFSRAKVIYDVHEDYKSKILSKSYLFLPLRKVIAILFDFLEKQISKSFDIVITADNYVKSRFKYKNVYRIANFPPVLNIKKLERNDGKFICVYAGGLSKERGLFQMVEALKYIDSPAGLFLLGKFENKGDLKKIKEFRKVKYFGQKPWHETIEFLGIADVGLNLLQPVPAYLYAGENTIKIFEYMMMGLPVISSDFPNLKKIIEENKCGITVDPTKPREIARAIKYLIENSAEAKKMGENGRKAVLEKYNWENESKKLLEIYEELLSK